MAGAYSYALLVELGENNTAKLKNKLVKYFQSKKSGGGECEVEYENGSRTATLSYCSLNVVVIILSDIWAHQISLDKGVLKVTVRLLKDESKTQVSRRLQSRPSHPTSVPDLTNSHKHTPKPSRKPSQKR
uniref:PAR14-like first RRM domain-containing protein n=1 Tax=Mola mola TaxID=94237 RepID=A0A3Q3X1C9_MOLML